MNKLNKIYNYLIMEYGYQGWWPLVRLKKKKGNYYHLGDYSFPKNRKEIYEICIGCILTQNTSFNNVEKSIKNLYENNFLDYKKILKKDIFLLKEFIRPCGYFNQKAEYILKFSRFFKDLKRKQIPLREELLKIKGIGFETADSILLYGYKKCYFVIDSYTKRMFLNLGLINTSFSYSDIQEFFHYNLKEDYSLYQEFHALIVKHCKIYYQKKENYKKDPLLRILN